MFRTFGSRVNVYFIIYHTHSSSSILELCCLAWQRNVQTYYVRRNINKLRALNVTASAIGVHSASCRTTCLCLPHALLARIMTMLMFPCRSASHRIASRAAHTRKRASRNRLKCKQHENHRSRNPTRVAAGTQSDDDNSDGLVRNRVDGGS